MRYSAYECWECSAYECTKIGNIIFVYLPYELLLLFFNFFFVGFIFRNNLFYIIILPTNLLLRQHIQCLENHFANVRI